VWSARDAGVIELVADGAAAAPGIPHDPGPAGRDAHAGAGRGAGPNGILQQHTRPPRIRELWHQWEPGVRRGGVQFHADLREQTAPSLDAEGNRRPGLSDLRVPCRVERALEPHLPGLSSRSADADPALEDPRTVVEAEV